MAGPGGKTAGRVSIRVVPDGTRWYADLKLMLKRTEQNVVANLQVTADTRSFEATVRKLQNNWNKQKVTLGVGATTAAARAQLIAVARPRSVPLFVEVNKTALAKAGALIAGLSGIRVAGDLVTNLTEKLGNLDRALPKIAAVATAVGSIGGLALSSIGGLATLGSGLGQVFGLAAVLPGILGGLAVGGTTLGLALADVKTQLAVLGPSFARLQDVVSRDFWKVARKPIIAFVRNTLPELQTGLATTSTALGNWASTVVGQISEAFGGGRITAMFQPLITSIDIAATGAGGFADALAVLGQVGGSYLPRLATAVADLSNRFGAFLLDIEASGRLNEIIENGIIAAKLLGSSIASISSILGGIATAATAAGGGGLVSFADILSRISDIVNGENFQTALTTLFAGAAAGASGLASAFGPIGDLIATLAPTLAAFLSGAGVTLGKVFGGIAEVLNNPVFAAGLGTFFSGILTGVERILPSLPALADAFAAFLTVAGTLAQTLGGVLGETLTALAPVLTEILDAVAPLIPQLGTAFVQAIQDLAPSLLEITQELLPILPELISGILIVLPELVRLFILMVPIIKGLADGLIEFTKFALTPTSEAFDGLAAWFEKLGPLGQLAADFINFLGSIFGGGLSGLIGAVTSFGVTFATTFAAIWAGLGTGVTAAFNGALGLVQGGINGLIDLINGAIAAINGLAEGLKTLTGGAVNIKIPKIAKVSLPRLAMGATILPRPGGTPFLGGDGGVPESVVDTGGMNRLIDATNRLLSGALAGNSGGQMPSELVIIDANGQLIGRMQVESQRTLADALRQGKTDILGR